MTSSNNKSEPNVARRPLAVDLFAGAGGMSLGFEQAGFDVVASVEVDPIHCAVHEFNFPRCATICADVSKIGGADIRKVAGLQDAPIDVVFGGPPCQGFSLIGKRALDDPRNRLLSEFVRIAADLNASYFVFENVKGLTVGKHRQLLEEVIESLHEAGYDVLLPYRVLNAMDFGVPQDRRRLFLVGAKRGLALPAYPEPKRQTATVWDAIGDLPDADSYRELIDDDAVGAEFGAGSAYARILRGLDSDPEDFSWPRSFDRHLLTSSMRTEHTPVSQDRFKATECGKVERVSRFLKLDPKGVSNTLRAGTGSDRGAFTSPRPIHPQYPRCITVREAARLHSYPDWFRLHKTKWHGFRQIGNSVPPLLGRAVAAELIKAMGAVPTKPAEALALGREELLGLTMSEAANRYGVPQSVVGRRLRPGEKREEEEHGSPTA